MSELVHLFARGRYAVAMCGASNDDDNDAPAVEEITEVTCAACICQGAGADRRPGTGAAAMKPTLDEQYDACVQDLLNDATHAEQQATDGPHFPDRGITADSLRQYAAECRANAERMRNREISINAYIRGALDKRADGTIRE